MGFKKVVGLVLFLFMSVSGTLGQPVNELTTIYEQGLDAADRAQYQQALDTWLSARQRGDSLSDPRIGIAFIELATRQGLSARYEQAAEMYQWGLSNPTDPQFADELDREIERIAPLLSYRDQRTLHRLHKEGNYRRLGQSIRGFWDWMDPTTSTEYNERLIKHWERIAYAKTNFNRGSSTVYGADERALTYVRYGAPDVVREGTITYRGALIQKWVDMAEVPGLTEYDVRREFKYPGYEIWKYRGIQNPRSQNLIYIFGDDGNTGEFRMLDALEEMMPNKAFRSSQTVLDNMMPVDPNAIAPPSFFLQLLFYREMTSVDPYFSEAYDEMEMRLFQSSEQTFGDPISQGESRGYRGNNVSKLSQIQMSTPGEEPGFEEELPSIPVDVRQYRLLNDQGEPYLATFLFSNPYETYFFDQAQEGTFDLSAYRLVGSAIGVDEANVVRYRTRSSPVRLSELEGYGGDIADMPPEQVYLEVPYDSATTDQRFTVELQNRRADTTRQKGMFAEHLRGLGDVQAEQLEPLPTAPGRLQMGDLIVGSRRTTADADRPFGFRVSPGARIRQGENLFVHFEVYNLSAGEGDNQFQLEYVVTKDMGVFNSWFGMGEKVQLSLNYETTDSDFRENLEIATSPFPPGHYILHLTANVPDTGQEVNRSIEFEVVENREVNVADTSE